MKFHSALYTRRQNDRKERQRERKREREREEQTGNRIRGRN